MQELGETASFRLIEMSDVEALLAFHIENRTHLQPWVPTPPPDFFTLLGQRQRLQDHLELLKLGSEYRFGVFDKAKMIASINLTGITYGAFVNTRLGYSVDRNSTGRGVATRFIEETCRFAFNELNLHRIEANVMPRNLASSRALEKCGFERIGHSPKMLKIAGVWEDHDMYARLSKD